MVSSNIHLILFITTIDTLRRKKKIEQDGDQVEKMIPPPRPHIERLRTSWEVIGSRWSSYSPLE